LHGIENVPSAKLPSFNRAMFWTSST